MKAHWVALKYFSMDPCIKTASASTSETNLRKSLLGPEAFIDTKQRRTSCEKELLESLNELSSAQNKLSKLSGRLCLANPSDFLVIPCDEKLMLKFNPAIKNASKSIELRNCMICWMLLCVLEDKLHRIQSQPSEHLLQTELECIREWNPWTHPEWLAFEVKQSIQIRPYQYRIVKQLLQNPGGMTQLNMGLGKTSVLVPMLILELRKTNQQIVRVNFLASILHTMTGNYRSILTASALHIKFFSLPFHRDVPLETYHAETIADELALCRESSGCLVVSPQHRNSLLLKQYDKNIFVDGLTHLLITHFLCFFYRYSLF